MKRNQIIILVLVVLAGFLVWWFVFTGNKAAAPTDNNTTTEDTSILPQDDPNQPAQEGTATNELPNSDGLAVLTQTAGSSVTIDNYKLSKKGFIVIHVSNVEDAPGAIIGKSGLLQARSAQDLEIKARIESGKSYIAMLYYDNGDGKFDINTDTPATSNGASIMRTFQVQ